MPTLDFNGKQQIYAHHLTVPHRPLIPDFSRSLNSLSEDDNLIIHGDNLHALKSLLPHYAGRVNCVYIDPPYNTGNEGWIYNDMVNSPLMKGWLQQNSPVDGEDLERHDKWLCMLWPRLHLLRELLADNGAIFVSIDDNEQHHLRMLMDDIFGEENYRNSIAIRRGTKNVQAQFEFVDSLNSGWEFILFYSKSPETKFRHLTKQLEDRRAGSWNNHWRGSDRHTMRYTLLGITPQSGQWRWVEKRSLKAIENYEKMIEEFDRMPIQDEIDQWWFDQSPLQPDLLRLSETGKPEHYISPSDRKIVGSLWTDLIANESPSMSARLMDGKLENPKRISLVKRVVEYMCGQDRDAIILDSFAGSGTTAHAVLDLNKEDGGNRKFILVECEDYADCITAERVRRVINGIPDVNDQSLQNGLGGSFAYCTLGDPLDIEKLLVGETLPSFSDLASYLLYAASGVSTSSSSLDQKNEFGLFHSDESANYYLLYKPDMNFLRSNEAMLGEEQAKRIHKDICKQDKKAIIFGNGQFISQRDLTDMDITFCQLPYALLRNS